MKHYPTSAASELAQIIFAIEEFGGACDRNPKPCLPSQQSSPIDLPLARMTFAWYLKKRFGNGTVMTQTKESKAWRLQRRKDSV